MTTLAAPVPAPAFPAGVPCGALVVSPLPVPRSEAEFHEIVQSTRTQAPNGLWVSGAFRWYSDPNWYGDVRPNPLDEGCWHDCCDYVFPGEDAQYLIFVSLDFRLPAAPPPFRDTRTPSTRVSELDLAAVPNVFRSAARLLERRVARAAYRGAGTYSYKRVVLGTRDTTMRQLWAAIGHVEGWGARSETDYLEQNGPLEHTATVSAVMADARPDADDDEEFYTMGGAIVEISW